MTGGIAATRGGFGRATIGSKIAVGTPGGRNTPVQSTAVVVVAIGWAAPLAGSRLGTKGLYSAGIVVVAKNGGQWRTNFDSKNRGTLLSWNGGEGTSRVGVTPICGAGIGVIAHNGRKHTSACWITRISGALIVVGTGNRRCGTGTVGIGHVGSTSVAVITSHFANKGNRRSTFGIIPAIRPIETKPIGAYAVLVAVKIIGFTGAKIGEAVRLTACPNESSFRL